MGTDYAPVFVLHAPGLRLLLSAPVSPGVLILEDDMVTLRVSKIENAFVRRAFIVATFLPVMAFNLTMFTGKLILYWGETVVMWPIITFKEARDVW